ncbi:hypothetical protein [Brevundimonas denitrificans]|uniref:hypothetical protein n=1 Tax=Brevundimonas denitrificans TaxID=1443434 RepID=UPI00223A6EB1|nr:hypothetical protein [Brevundimonas denitrificans]
MDRDVEPGPRQLKRDGPADAACSAGDQRRAAWAPVSVNPAELEPVEGGEDDGETQNGGDDDHGKAPENLRTAYRAAGDGSSAADGL